MTNPDFDEIPTAPAHTKPEDAVAGALEILHLSNAFRDNWPAMKVRIVARAGAMLCAYRAIIDQARNASLITAERDRAIRAAIELGDDIVQALRCEEPPARESWDDVTSALADTLSILAADLGFAASK